MALTVTVDATKANVVGSKRNQAILITFPNPYVVGGVALSAAQCGLVVLERVIFENPATNSGSSDTLGFVAKYNRATGKVQVYKSNGTTNLIEATAVDLSAISVNGTAVGY